MQVEQKHHHHRTLNHSELKENMYETMKETVSGLYTFLKRNNELLTEIFTKYVFVKDTKNPILDEKWNLAPGTKLHSAVVYLHNLYNDPDKTSRVSNISADKKTMHVFRLEMKNAFDYAKTDEEDAEYVAKPAAAPTPIPAATAAPVYDPAKYEAVKIIDTTNDEPQLVEFESYVLKPQNVPPTLLVLEPKKSHKLPYNSHNFHIKGDNGNYLEVEHHSDSIRIELSHASIHIHHDCSNITIDAGRNSFVRVDEDCENITIHGIEPEGFKIHKQCKNITTNGAQIRP